MIIYIAGPMTGMPDLNRAAFRAAEEYLKNQGHIVLNPIILPGGLRHDQYMTICLPMVDVADAVYLLPGWEDSKGAKMEWARASSRMKKIIRHP